MTPSSVSRDDSEEDVFTATLYGEARGEVTKGIEAVAHVILTRAKLNRSYWGGSSVKNVCLHKYQFECWENKTSMDIREPKKFEECRRIGRGAKDGTIADPTNGCDHFYNPDKLPQAPSWVKNCDHIITIGHHKFLKSKGFC